jgi:energy-coupling factor transporter ATP-binding protein EcfA2
MPKGKGWRNGWPECSNQGSAPSKRRHEVESGHLSIEISPVEVETMFVNRLCFRDVKSLNHDIPEDGQELPEPARSRLLLQGGNGSGKTTIFEAIATLWKFWGEWIEIGQGGVPPRHQLRHFLADVGLAAMEIHSLADGMAPIWLGIGRISEWDELNKSYPDHSFARLFRSGRQWRIDLPPQGAFDLQNVRNFTLMASSIGVVAPGGPVISATAKPQSLLRNERFANIVYFPSKCRTLRDPAKLRAVLLDFMPFNWVAQFDRNLNLGSVLLTLKTREPEQFEECLKFVNLALVHGGKRITGFGENARLVVEEETESGQRYHHAIEELSSGEKQMLLMIGFTMAFLQLGGILLIDEPDLHIHVSMVSQLMETLDLIAKKRSAQLIVASHSGLVWDWFDDEERVDLSGWREDVPLSLVGDVP